MFIFSVSLHKSAKHVYPAYKYKTGILISNLHGVEINLVFCQDPKLEFKPSPVYKREKPVWQPTA